MVNHIKQLEILGEILKMVASFIVPAKKSSNLKKAILKNMDGGQDIKLMFNPTDISFTRTISWTKNDGNRGTTLLPKISFSSVDPYKFTLKQLLFDTYETKESVMKHIDIIKQGVETIKQQPDSRPPVYKFIWDKEYFLCVMTSLTYTLNMFLSDGTPVRALVDISLQEVDKSMLPGTPASASAGTQRLPDPKVARPG